MANKTLSVLKYLISLLLAFALLYFAFRNVDFDAFWSKAQTVNFTWVILSIVLSVVAYYARAYRWNILLRPLGYHHLNVHRTTLAILVGYLANLALPRLGEVTRCGMLKRSDDVGVSASFGTVITERIIDLITLIFLIFFVLLMEYDRFVEFLQGAVSGLDHVEGLFWKAGILLVAIGGVAVLILYFLIKKSIKVREFFRQLIEGILSLRRINNLFGFIVSTVVLWVVYYYMSYIIVFSIPETSGLGWMVGVMLLVTSGIALAIPVQGGIGTYHALVSSMFVLYEVELTTGVFLATLLHTSQVVAMAVFGGLALLISLFIKQRKHEPNQTEDRH